MLSLIMAVSNFELMLCVCITTHNLAFRLSLCSIWYKCFVFLHFNYITMCNVLMWQMVICGSSTVHVMGFILCVAHMSPFLFFFKKMDGIETVCLSFARRGNDAGSTWCSWRLWRPVRKQRWVTHLLVSGDSCSCVLLHC